jgi:hypothetical protein
MQDKEVVPLSSVRARHAAEESEERMLGNFEMGSSFENREHEHAIITVYPRAFDNARACLPHMSSFSIDDEHGACDDNVALDFRREERSPVLGEREVDENLVLSSNGMHVGSVAGDGNDRQKKAGKKKKSATDKEHLLPSDKQGRKGSCKQEETIQEGSDDEFS